MRGVVTLMIAVACSTAVAGDLDGLRWLEGTWKRDTSRGAVYERWLVASERTFEGESWRESESGERRPGESMLLAVMGGEVFYIPRPVENPYPVAFKLVETTAHQAVFENPQHDFPTRIGYRREEDDSMTAWIEGPGEGHEPRRIEFRFKRVK
jgi:hypothetical protein